MSIFARQPSSEPSVWPSISKNEDKELKEFINRRLEKNPLFAWRLIEGVVLLVPVKQPGPEIRRLYRLKDPVSSRIWELVDGRRTAQEIHQALCQEFDTEAQRIKRDLLKFLKHLKSIGAVQVATTSAGKQKSSRLRLSLAQGPGRLLLESTSLPGP